MMRFAAVNGKPEQIEPYLPRFYTVIGGFQEQGYDFTVIAGEDHAGWTFEDYVQPRLASGLHTAVELVAISHVNDDKVILDRLAYLLSAPEWPGASGMEDVAELVARVRDINTNPDAVWHRH